jgi:hypothetical protein
MKSRRLGLPRYVVRTGDNKSTQKFRNSEEKIPLGRPRLRWGFFLQWILREEEGVDCIELA